MKIKSHYKEYFLLLLGLLLIPFLLLAIVLIGKLYLNRQNGVVSHYDAYIAIAELLFVAVVSVEGLGAYLELAYSRKGAKIAANSAILQLHQLYLSVDYQQKVRRPAWFSLTSARQCPEYRKKLLAGLAGELVGDETRNFIQNSRLEKPQTESDKESLMLHDDYHRVQDIFGLFTALSILSEDADEATTQMCGFFYDRWRVPLHRVVHDLEAYCSPKSQENQSEQELKSRRSKCYKSVLENLDKRFDLARFDWRLYTRYENIHVPEGQIVVSA